MGISQTNKYRPSIVPGASLDRPIWPNMSADTNALLLSTLAPIRTVRYILGNDDTVDDDCILFCDITANATLRLRTPSNIQAGQGKLYWIVDMAAGSTVTLVPQKNTIDNGSSYVIAASGQACVIYDGTRKVWYVISTS